MTLHETLLLRWWKAVEKKDNARIATLTPTPGITEVCDIPYRSGGHRGHLLDVYYPQGTAAPLPVLIDIHGGGFTYGYKELNKLYNLYLSSLGFTVVSLNYRLAPQVRFTAQVQDLSAAFHWLAAHGQAYPCDMDNIFVTGDSAGGLFAMLLPLLEHSPALQAIYGVTPSGLNIRALGLVSGALSMRSILRPVLARPVFGPRYRTSPAFRSLDPAALPGLEQLPPCYLVTSREDFIRSCTLDFAQVLRAKGVPFELHDWPKVPGKRLDHVFSVLYPTMEESVQTSAEMTAFFRSHAKQPAQI